MKMPALFSSVVARRPASVEEILAPVNVAKATASEALLRFSDEQSENANACREQAYLANKAAIEAGNNAAAATAARSALISDLIT